MAIESKSSDGVTIGLIEALLSVATVLNRRLKAQASRMRRSTIEHEWFSEDVRAALLDLSYSRELCELMHPYDEEAMDIVRCAARLIKSRPTLTP